MILAIDPGNIQSAYVLMDDDLKPTQFAKTENENMLAVIEGARFYGKVKTLAVEMVASYGMPVGAEVFETCVWIGRFIEAAKRIGMKVTRVYRKDVKMNLCGSMKAKDSNIRQALIDRFGVVGVKKAPGWFYGFKADIWAAYAVGVTYYDMILKGRG